MKIKLNGEEQETKAISVDGLLKELEITPERVAVEINFEIVRKSEYSSRNLKEGDQVEIVSFMGGGGMDKAGCSISR